MASEVDSPVPPGIQGPATQNVTNKTPGQEPNSLPQYGSESPPSYESLFGKVRQMRDESTTKFDFGKKLFGCLFCGLACKIIVTTFMFAVPISCLVFGSLYVNECPREKYVPIYLIVAGVFGVIKGITGVADMIIKKNSSDDESNPSENKAIRAIDVPITCFLSAWFIAGSVWVYRIYKDYSTDPTSSDYCNPTLYTFAFVILTIQYSLALLALVCCVCTSIVVCCMAANQN